MERKDIITKVEEIYEEILEMDSIHLEDEMTANDVEGWDSLTHGFSSLKCRNDFK